MTEQYNMIVIPQNGRYCQFQIDMEYFINICNYETMWKIAALLRDANQVDKSLLSTVTVFSSNFAFVYISNVILISLSRQENLSKDMNESNNELVLDELFYDLLIYVSQTLFLEHYFDTFCRDFSLGDQYYFKDKKKQYSNLKLKI